MKADNDEKLDLEYYKGIHKGLLEFIDLIDSMKELSGRNLIITFVSGMVGYSCQALVHEKKENYILISTKNNWPFFCLFTIVCECVIKFVPC